ncbi:MAG: PadR family transcriptional regulator [Streptosporangiales bacterium]|nr:PadR family transcriptional regulator [Streptosporangiales bacterium]
MSATRLLVLGVVRGHGRAHGYLVQAELVSWGPEAWANVKWGSLYHALRQMAKEGLLHATEIADWPGRVDYKMTEAGEAEFLRLLRDALRRPGRPDMLAAGLALLPALPRAEAFALLKERLTALEADRDDVDAQAHDRGGHAHLRELFDLRVHTADAAVEWTRGLIERLETGAYVMADEDGRAFGAPGSLVRPERGPAPRSTPGPRWPNCR